MKPIFIFLFIGNAILVILFLKKRDFGGMAIPFLGSCTSLMFLKIYTREK